MESIVKEDYGNYKAIVDRYKKILNNTEIYREMWRNGSRKLIVEVLEELNTVGELGGKVVHEQAVENLELVMFSMGRKKSGIAQKVSEQEVQQVFKTLGGLAFQQLFNGKIVIWLNYPYIDGMGEPRPPKTLEIIRPTELTRPLIIRHTETFLKELTLWEDYDDDIPQKSKIGFQRSINPQ